MNPSGHFFLLFLLNFALFGGHALQCKGRHSPKSLGCVAKWEKISVITNSATSPFKYTQIFSLRVLATRPFMDSQGLSPQQYYMAFESNPSDISLSWTVVESMEHADAFLTRAARAKYAQLGRRGNIAAAFRGWTQFTRTFTVPPKTNCMLHQAVIRCRRDTVEFSTGEVRLKTFGRH